MAKKPLTPDQKARQRIAGAVRTFAKENGLTRKELVEEWGIKPATLDNLVGSKRSPAAVHVPRLSTLLFVAEKTELPPEYLLGFSDRESRDVTVPKAELAKDLHAYVTAKIVSRGVRAHAAKVLLPDPDALLAEIVEDYAESIGRLDAKEVRRKRQWVSGEILRRLAHLSTEELLRADLPAIHGAALKLATASPKQPVAETSSGVSIWPEGFGKDLPIRQRSADHEHTQDRIDAMRAKRRRKSKRRRKQ